MRWCKQAKKLQQENWPYEKPVEKNMKQNNNDNNNNKTINMLLVVVLYSMIIWKQMSL